MTCFATQKKSPMQSLSKLLAVALVTVVGSFPTMASAQSDKMITLLYEGEDGISGELLEYNGTVYKIAANVGRLTIPAEGITCIGEACPEGTRLEPTLPRVKLTAPDGSFTVEGNLIDVTDSEYVLATDIGEFRMEIDRVTCEGKGCPETRGELPAVGTVIMRNGDVTIEGTLIGLDSTDFVLQTKILGTVRLKRSEFECNGVVCP